MSNGKISTREFLARIDERTINIQDNLTAHLNNHKWVIMLVIGMPTALCAIILLIKGAIK